MGVVGWFIGVTPFALLGLIFTWRFAVWHQKAISSQAPRTPGTRAH